ncbi:peptidoglycan DD-metalloendopeptidase family protein [Aphanizomenon sp. PH219]|uniref:Peptidoglycan DD-metalloendopeptidase family protein n=1 Tax=Dolichospermum heterosporum TAC447 TaxID=747523 RepID=A0ABY5LWB6_9CYAN|nr:peptidoglycan DD-metalloendopeptidase family protein [Dolichospermum heterosporum]MDK2411378.1 peptidoglycan DD-metalloendopeptidase family protein [Aphanizomenon sp. 202]MDK2461118.1 peptidoglycan DD-metalloendopeptidase family protein [Aphanizomenon sp. PH219]UUO13889.1 peptidoglycan DD-metalloendopeptidase family protein [Dolichospermum heterosporum TAC447]
MKRALKKRDKAVLNNTPSGDDAPVEQTNYEINPKMTRRARTHRAAMIGLAISMGATSLLVTRQSDQAQAAAPVGSQKAASTNPSVAETEMKFAATKLEAPTVSPTGELGNPVILEPTVVSQVPGLEAKWQIATNSTAVEGTASNVISPAKSVDRNSVHSQLAPGVSYSPIQATLPTNNQQPETASKLSTVEEVTGSTQNLSAGELAGGNVDAQLKAQQEFALNRLQEKSIRLRNSLADLRSEQAQDLLKTGIQEAQPTTVANRSVPEQSQNLTDFQQSDLIYRLKQNKETSATIQQIPVPASASTKVVAQLSASTYQVKPGDTLAEIANSYGTSVSELVRTNNLSDPNQLQINQRLIIPADKILEASSQVDNSSLNNPSFNPRSFVANNTSVTIPAPKINEQVEGIETPATNSVAIPVPVVTQEQEQTNYPTIANRINVPAPIVPDSQGQATIPIVIPKALPTPSNSYGLGGDAPLPRAFSQKQGSQKPVQKVSQAKGNERIRSLQAEIERLRYKYRAQQSGVAVTAPENNIQSVPVAIESSNKFTVSQANAIQIAVPQAILPSYSNQPLKTLVTASAPTNEPINPEFLPSKTGARWNSPPKSSGIKLTVPPARTSASDSLGKLRGTSVSPALPPIAAVDIHLPQTTEDNPSFPANSSTTGYIWPAKGVLTSGYGWRWGRMHRGIDIANSTGTPIYASSAGVVEKAGWNSGGYGNVVDIRHDDGSLTRYGHNSRILVQSGQRVQQGQPIAAMGSTGFSTGPHSHFEVHPSGKGAVNPIAFLPNRI